MLLIDTHNNNNNNKNQQQQPSLSVNVFNSELMKMESYGLMLIIRLSIFDNSSFILMLVLIILLHLILKMHQPNAFKVTKKNPKTKQQKKTAMTAHCSVISWFV